MTTYHLRPNHEGSDSNTGTTYNNAWSTFAKANTILNPGDTLMVHERANGAEGVYSEWVQWERNGSAGNPITIQAEGAVWLDGLFQYPTNTNRAGAEYPSGTAYDVSFNAILETWYSSYVDFDGINIRNSKGRGFRALGDR